MADRKSPAKRASKAPISAHPAFPAIVALWFAALFGIGCLILPARLLEGAMAPLGLSLGLGGHALSAALVAIVGGMTGFVLGRRIADAPGKAASANAGRNSTPAPRAPFNAREAMEAAESEDAAQRGKRRRSLAMEEDQRESDFLIVAPVPGGDEKPPRIGELRPTTVPAPGQPALSPGPQPAQGPSAPLELALPEMTDSEPGTPAIQEPETLQEFESSTEQEQVQSAARSEDAPVERDATREPDFEQPLVFNAPSLARQRDVEDVAAEMVEGAHNRTDNGHSGHRVELELVSDSSPDGEYEGNWVAAPLDQLGLVQLVQRLGSSLERHRSLLAARPVIAETQAPPHEPAFAADLEAAPAEEASQAMAAFFNRQLPVTAEPEEETENDFVASFNLPLTREGPSFAPEKSQVPSQPAESGEADTFAYDAEADEEVEEELAENENFGSLVEMHNPFRFQESGFVRVEEPEDDEEDGFIPAVIFPSQQTQPGQTGIFAVAAKAPPPAEDSSTRPFDPPAGAARVAPAQTDEALRDALAKLQRANGVG